MRSAARSPSSLKTKRSKARERAVGGVHEPRRDLWGFDQRSSSGWSTSQSTSSSSASTPASMSCRPASAFAWVGLPVAPDSEKRVEADGCPGDVPAPAVGRTRLRGLEGVPVDESFPQVEHDARLASVGVPAALVE